ncbi:MAG: hypothetical protein AAFY35_12125 [Pseudomonadota bacterium]
MPHAAASTPPTSTDNSEERAQEDAYALKRRVEMVDVLAERLTIEELERLKQLASMFEAVNFSTDEARLLIAAFSTANGERLRSDDPEQSILPFVAKSLSSDSKDQTPYPEAFTAVPPLYEAPRDAFRGTYDDGDPYTYLLEHYDAWLQPKRRCLDRPTLKVLDGKLLRALQQRYARNNDSMPPLSEIFPGKKEARANRETFIEDPKGRHVEDLETGGAAA